MYLSLTHSVNKQLWLAREVVIDDIVQHRYVNAPSLRHRKNINYRQVFAGLFYKISISVVCLSDILVKLGVSVSHPLHWVNNLCYVAGHFLFTATLGLLITRVTTISRCHCTCLD